MGKVKTNRKAIFGVIICTALTSVSQILWKIGIDSDASSFFHKLVNINVILGGFLYFLAASGLVVSFRGGELSVLYPVVSLSFVWVSLMSLIVLGENISVMNWLGVISIVCGVSLINIKN